MDNVNFTEFSSKILDSNFLHLCRGFKVGDCVKISSVCCFANSMYPVSVLGCITDISFSLQFNSQLIITVKDCVTNIEYLFYSFDDFKKVNCNGC